VEDEVTGSCACGSREASSLYTVKGFPIVTCGACGLGRTELPEGFDPALIYAESYFDGGQADGYVDYRGSRDVLCAEFRCALDVLARQGARSGSLIEVGCAYGFFLDEARARFSVCGVEVSDAARQDCISRGLAVERALTPELVAAHGPFDVAVMLDVIEHLSDPAALLADLRRSMRSGGRLLLTTGDFSAPLARLFGRRWRLMTPPQHLWFFSPVTLGSLLSRTGFRIASVEHPAKIVPLSLIAFQAARLLGASVPVWARRVPGGIPINLFDAMRVVAEAV
jgi:SAM-dependent methyltransferase